MLTSRERVEVALAHKEPDRLPLDLGATPVTGMHVNVVYALRQALKLDPPGTPVKVWDPYQMLGVTDLDLLDALGADVVGVHSTRTMFGFRNEGWKPWTTFQGTPVLVPEGFNTEPEPDGDLLQYPEGDKSVPPSGRMPKGGVYFDAIIRQPPIDEENLSVEDDLEEFGPLEESELEHFRSEVNRLHEETDKAILLVAPGTGFGDIALVPAPWLKHPKGIRDITEWYMSIKARPEYLKELFTRQCEIALENLERLHEAVGDKVTAVMLTGTDFGTQRGPFLSVETYKELFQPFHKRLNDWVHHHTTWKTFIHSCGGVRPLIPHFIEAGFDILNPVQCSARGMDPRELKAEYGEAIVFWGGGVDTQKTLPFGTPEEVKREVEERVRIFGPGGGFVFNTIHNVQPGSPVENVLALYETVRRVGVYPIGES